MAERIKGLQIDLSLNDMDVSKKLSNVKREFRALDSSMKVSNNNFKYGNKSAAAYKDRMSELQTAVDGSSKHLEQLKRRHSEVSAEQGAGSKAALDLANQINKETNAFNMYKSQLSSVTKEYQQNFSMLGKLSNSFSSIGSGLQGVGQKAQDMERSLSNSITKPALIAGTAMAGITAKLGFDRLVGLDSAKAKLEGLGYSTKEVGSITDQVAKAIEGGMTTMAEGTDVAAGALAAGVKEGKELEKYIKLVGDAAVGSNRPVSDMAMIFNRVQGQGKLMTQELNMIEEGMPGFSNAMAEHLGVSYDAFREMVTNGEVTSKDFLTVMDDFAGGMAKAYSKSWQGMLQNTKAYIGQIGESLLGGVFEQAKGSLHEFEKLLKSPGAQQWAKETGEKLGNAFTTIGNGIKSVINWWNSLDGSTQKVFGSIAKWLAITLVAIGPLLTIFGKLATVTGGMFTTFGQLTGNIAKVAFASKEAGSILGGLTQVFPKLGTAITFATGPVGLIIAGVVALGTALVIAYKKSETFRNIVNGAFTGIVNGAKLLWSGIMTILTPIGQAFMKFGGQIKSAIGDFWSKYGAQFMQAITNIKNGFLAFWSFISPVLGYIGGLFKSTFSDSIPIINFFKDLLMGSLVHAFNIVKNTVMIAFNAIKGIIMGVLNVVMGFVKMFIGIFTGDWKLFGEGLKQVATSFLSILKNLFQLAFAGILGIAKTIWGVIKNTIVGLAKGIWTGVKNAFTWLKNSTVSIFNSVKAFAINVWNWIKDKVVGFATSLWSGVKSRFNSLKNSITIIFGIVKNFLFKVWLSIRSKVISLAVSLYNGVRNRFNSLKNSITSIFNSVRNFLYDIWNKVRNKVVSIATSLWNGVKDKFNNLKNSIKSIIGKVKNNLYDTWDKIWNKVTDVATSLKDKVTGTFGKMRDVLEDIIGKIKGFIDDMVDKVKKGLNKLIDGVNWVGGKLGMDKLPKVKLHTGTEHTTTQNVVTNGKINRDTFATVGDKGRGNGPGGFRHEAIKYPNGKMALTPNKDTTAFLPKGSSVMNGAQTHSMLNNMPKFASGTLSNKKPKKKKKGDNFFGDVATGVKAGAKVATGKVVDGGKAVVNKTLETAVKGKKWMEDKIGDVMEWIDKPGKLLDKVLEGIGLNLDGFGISKAAELPFDMMKGMFSKLKKAAIDTFTSWMSDAAEGDGGYIDLSKGINFPFSPNGKAPGYPFAGPHMGVDINYIYDKLYSVLAGKATARKGWNGGFGNMVDIVKGATKVIYGHMSKHAFSGSKNVKPGDYLGVSGNSGKSSGPHLHFEVQKNGVPIDPLKWLKKNNGEGKSGGKYGSAIKKALGMAGLPQTSKYIKAWQSQAKTESTFNPKAKNPSGASGLVQVKPGTFNQYKLPGHGNIWNPLDNLIAGMRYAKARYGKSGMLSQIGHGLPYATGGLINSSGLYNLAEEGYPEFVIPTDPSRQSDAMKLLAIATQRIEGNKKNKRPNQMRTPSTNNNNDNEMINVMARQLEATQRQVELLTQLVASNQRLEQKPTGVSEQDMSKAQGKRAQMMAYNMGGAF
ncbi:phage tail tape measure protein [Staphylococcus nepalensis]|uniref:tape measure protein n=1 Tax=Staphylococcus nepalensis TaxID=214473 RepID=UPI000D58A727|nr:tape measure protein [Staphylococcus nepalensis]AWI45087.1 phage tail tape measure protein [Staphylococcus nepalensis]